MKERPNVTPSSETTEEMLKKLYSSTKQDKEEVHFKMKKKKRISYRKPAVAAACALIIFTLPFTSFGSEIVETVKRVASPSGRIVVNEDKLIADPEKMDLPDYLKGKIFDKDGKEITNCKPLSEEHAIFSKDGREIASIDYDKLTGNVTFEYKDEQKEDTGDKSPINDIAKKLSFHPLVLSSNYHYVESEIYAESGKLSDYVTFTYEKNGKTIYLHERISSPETAYETGGEGKIDEVNVDGVKVILQGHNADFERDGLLLSISAKGANKDELIAMVKDLHLLK